ncbi:MAG: hypothetical protein KDA65_07975 [Planctomycetaceae bacterium]|nr:hypothetical protein [Planctomycetaceae bacterium]
MFRTHLEREFSSIDEILPLKHLYDKWNAEAARIGKVEELRNLLRPEEFLYRDLPADDDSRQVLFLALKLFEVNHTMPPIRDLDTANRLHNQSNTLTTIIQKLDAARDKEEGQCGIVLRARSGGGKTLSCRRAMYDCFPIRGTVAGTGDHRPAPLGGYLPCFVRTTEPLALGEVKSLDAKELDSKYLDLIIDLLAKQSDLPEGPDRFKLLKRILAERCPPLLIFIDLNTSGPQERLILARGIKLFQEAYGKHGHRCIVTYRTNEVNDAVMDEFNDSTLFRHFDMTSITSHEATIYLREYRKFERWVCEQLEIPLDERDIDQEVNLLKQFLSLYAAGAESLVSTPLLMHWVASLDSLDGVESITDLYDRVIAQQIRYEHNNQTAHIPARLRGEDGKRRIINAATRIALYMQSQNTTRLSRYQFEKCVKSPWDLGTRWWPNPPASKNDLNWRNSSYYLGEKDSRSETKASQWTIKEDEDEIKGLTNFSLFRREQSETGQSEIGFLHDSMIPYFTGGVALVQHEEPESEIYEESKWMDAVTKRLRDDAVIWELPAEFLGGAVHRLTRPGEDDPLVRVLTRRLILEARENDPAWVKLLQRYSRGASSDPVLYEVEFALRRNPGFLIEHSEQILSEVVNFVEHIDPLDQLTKGFTKLLQEEWYENSCLPVSWLHVVKSPPLDHTSTMSSHESTVTCVIVLQDGRIVSGCIDGKVLLYDPQNGVVEIIIHVEFGVRCLAVLPNSRIAIGCMDGRVEIYNISRKNVEAIIRNENTVTCLAVLKDEHILIGTDDRWVKLYSLKGGPLEPIVRLRSSVRCIAVLPDGRFVIGSRYDSLQIYSQPKWSDWLGWPEETIIQHTDSVTCIAVLPDSRIVCGSEDGSVQLFDLHGNPLYKFVQQESAITCLAILPDGRIVSGSEDGSVRLYDQLGGAPETVVRRQGRVTCLAVLPDGRIVSGDEDRTVKLFDMQGEPPNTNTQGQGAVTCLKLLADGRFLSGTESGSVQLHDPQGELSETIIQHEGKVNGMALLPDGSVISGSSDGTVIMYDSKEWEVEMIIEKGRQNPCVMWLPDGRILMGKERGAVEMYDPQGHFEGTIIRHEVNIVGLAVLANGRIISSSSDGTVKMYDPQRGEEKTVIQNTLENRCSAVLPDGRIVGGFDTGWVGLRNPQKWGWEMLFQHSRTVTCLAVLPEGIIISGCTDGTVILYDLHLSHPNPVIHMCGSIESLIVFQDKFVGITANQFVHWHLDRVLTYKPQNQLNCIEINSITGNVICGTTHGLLILEHVTKDNTAIYS